MDIALIQKQAGGAVYFDLALDGFDLAADGSLRTAVILSLLCDRRAEEDDEIPDGTTFRRGWWADAYSETEGDRWGSRLWLLRRSKQLPETLRKAREYAEEALAWLVEDGVATSVSVTAEVVRNGVLGLLVQIELPAGGRFEEVFNYSLEGV
ncbi:phage GP46 family protein [Desulfocurvibacter africanus]|uniref:GP46 family protein n=1 Tax=Desulfocurvibacter africanus subsp. africanus str. Walvis Bay TaxID=690850 RepID=F3YW27_DESAF|nr:phage GP46 family protein [Desulfocurvibacter africanus]EGJ49057.1 GP46 family protein [Desulfocurvibacter africanus subsp. africanus str. Walvis Bay]